MRKEIKYFKRYYHLALACLAGIGVLSSAINLYIGIPEEDALSIVVNSIVIIIFLYLSFAHGLKHVKKERFRASGNQKTTENEIGQ